MLVDEVEITIKAGNGGKGSGAFHTLPTSPKPRPDGGNGGRGGDVYLQGSHNISDLSQFRFSKKVEASDGEDGRRNNQYGKSGEDEIVLVPLGTRLTDQQTGEVIDIQNEEPILIARGGEGGMGNHQYRPDLYPNLIYTPEGGHGEIRDVKLELLVIADIGLIGLPNAGKSSLLEALTNATPKVGNYPFTTLEPNLGILTDSKKHIIIADIPGIIEGAHEGRGLGLKFLKHVERTKLLIHCIDSSDPKPAETYNTIHSEFENHNPTLLQKEEIILLTKTDLVDEKTVKEKIREMKKLKKEVKVVSIYNEKQLQDLQILLEEKIVNSS